MQDEGVGVRCQCESTFKRDGSEVRHQAEDKGRNREVQRLHSARVQAEQRRARQADRQAGNVQAGTVSK